MRRVIQAAKDKKFTGSDNATILSDATSLMKCQKIGFGDFVKVMKAFSSVSNSETLDMVKTSLATIKKYMEDGELIKQVNRYYYLFLKDSYAKLGLIGGEDDSAEDKKLRGTVVAALAAINDDLEQPLPEVTEFLQTQLEDLLANPNDNKISNDLKPAVIFFGLFKLADESKLNS